MKNLDFEEFLAGVRAGDPQAAEELVRRYEPVLRQIIRPQLDDRLRRLFDTLDIWQSVLGDFFVRATAGRFELKTADDLQRLLVTMARNKLISKARKVRRHGGSIPAGLEMTTIDYEPSRQVDDLDLVETIRQRLTPKERELFDRKKEGKTWSQIAEELAGDPDALRMQLTRAIARIKRRLQ